MWFAAASAVVFLAADMSAAAAQAPIGCGLPYKAPVLHPVRERIENVTTGAWIWSVNICLTTFGEMECNSLAGLVVGNSSHLYTKWILTAMDADTEADRLIVVVGADTAVDLINPAKVKVYLVKRVIPFDRPWLFVFPMPCLLELYDSIILSEITKIVPVCLPLHRAGEEIAFNNTPGWVVGWTNNWVEGGSSSRTALNMSKKHRAFGTVLGNSTMVTTRRQFYTNTLYDSSPRELVIGTNAPASGELFFDGSAVLKRDKFGHWFAHGISMESGDDFIAFERPDLVCDWIYETTSGEVACTTFNQE